MASVSSSAPTHWADIQQATFTRWANEHLRERGLHCKDLKHDLKNGLLLCNLMEVISNKSLGRFNHHPKVPQQQVENCAIAVNFIQNEGIKLVNISGMDIHEGRIKLILGLIWTLILRYQINKGDNSGAEDELLKWVRSKIGHQYEVNNFTTDWNDGKKICALVEALRPGLIPNHLAMSPGNALQNATTGIQTADDKLGVAQLILPNEMTNPKVDKLAMMTYISQFRNLKPVHGANHCTAYGDGLVEGVVNTPLGFTVEGPSGSGRLEVKVEGPSGPMSNSGVQVTQHGSNWNVRYTPTEVGIYKVSVRYAGTGEELAHIPGSVFTVIVREYESLGGEGKIRVFVSTTSSNEKGRMDTHGINKLMTEKNIDKRPDFEPFVAVDILDREDREAIFRRAGTRNLPIVFIDDQYMGDYDAMMKLDQSGKLDQLLQRMKYDATFDPEAKWRRDHQRQ